MPKHSSAISSIQGRCRRRYVAGLLGSLLGLSGCAGQGWDTERAPADFEEGQRILAEVVMVTTREQALSEQGLLRGWGRKMVDSGRWSPADVADGSVVTVFTYCFGHNSGVPLCQHSGHYVAYVPESLRGTLQPDLDNDPDANGDLVEVTLSRTPNGDLVGEVVGVHRRADDWGSCRIARLEGLSAAYVVSPVGPPRAIWIECEGLEMLGWRRRPAIAAPMSAGPPVSEWIRLP